MQNDLNKQLNRIDKTVDIIANSFEQFLIRYGEHRTVDEQAHERLEKKIDYTNGTNIKHAESIDGLNKEIDSLKTWKYGLILSGIVAVALSGTIIVLAINNLENSIREIIDDKIGLSKGTLNEETEKFVIKLLEDNHIIEYAEE